jgi:hypothetical protein
MDAYRPFALRVIRVVRLSSTFHRVTLAAAALAGMGYWRRRPAGALAA